MSKHEHPTTEYVGTGSHSSDASVDTDELLCLLGDEHTREILATLGGESLPAREIAEQSSVSRPTVYRRLNSLEAAGAVESVMTVHPEGQHRKEFRVVVDKVELCFGGDDIAVTAESESSAPREPTHRRPVAHSGGS